MHVIRANNVNDAYFSGLNYLYERGQRQSSRAGDVIVSDQPVTTRYASPMCRVLFDKRRNANPIFHLWESLWMLRGRNDATFLDLFVHDFSRRFAEEDGNQHGAYGFRWKYHFDMEGGGDDFLVDQLRANITLLKMNSDDRRTVIQMWDPVADLGVKRKDVPCNLTATPRIVNGALDLTVFCRSNDAIWGAYGANAVHFSFLQEYLAAMIGVPMGAYYQVSNNFHAYEQTLAKLAPRDYIRAKWLQLDATHYDTFDATIEDHGDAVFHNRAYHPLVTNPPAFEQDLNELFVNLSRGLFDILYRNPFLHEVAVPMYEIAYGKRHKNPIQVRMALTKMPPNCDWTVATRQWLEATWPMALAAWPVPNRQSH